MEEKKKMKKINSLKLNELTGEELDRRSLEDLKAGVNVASPCNCSGWHYTIDNWKV